MPHYIAEVFLAPDRTFEMVPLEVNKLIAPQELLETDRFDEVPGFVAEFDPIEVRLLGIPSDASTEEMGDDPAYCLTIFAVAAELTDLPPWLRPASSDLPKLVNGYIDLSARLAQAIYEGTNLRCVDDAAQE